MADDDDRDAIGAFGDGGHGSRIGGFHCCAGGCLDVDAFVFPFGILTDDCAIDRPYQLAGGGGFGGWAHIGYRLLGRGGR